MADDVARLTLAKDRAENTAAVLAADVRRLNEEAGFMHVLIKRTVAMVYNNDKRLGRLVALKMRRSLAYKVLGAQAHRERQRQAEEMQRVRAANRKLARSEKQAVAQLRALAEEARAAADENEALRGRLEGLGAGVEEPEGRRKQLRPRRTNAQLREAAEAARLRAENHALRAEVAALRGGSQVSLGSAASSQELGGGGCVVDEERMRVGGV